jgi:TonB family protein
LTAPWQRLALALGVSALLHLAALLLLQTPSAPPATGDFPMSVLIVPLERGAPPAVPPPVGARARPERQIERNANQQSAVPPMRAPGIDPGALQHGAFITMGPASAPSEVPASRLADAASYVAAERLGAPPRLVGRVTVSYPRLAYQQRRTGVVLMQLMIDESGTVTEAVPLPGASEDFVEAALDALRQARFRPALGPEGRPARARAYFAISFVLE